MEGLESLLVLAQLAVGLAGFSAVVIVLRRERSGLWRRRDANRFNGMLTHALVGAGFAFVPIFLDAFQLSAATVWAWSSGIFAVTTLFHATFAIARERIAGWKSTLYLFVFGYGIALMLFLNALGIGFDRSFAPYLLAVGWHVGNAGILFLMLVFVPNNAMQE